MSRLIPQRNRIAAPDIVCNQNSYTIVKTGQTVTTNQYGQPLNGDALAQALRFHGFPGVIVEVHGNQHKGMQVNGNNPNLSNTVMWKGQNVHNVTIIGGDPNKAARIGGVAVFDKTGNLHIENVTLMNDGFSATPFIVNQNGIAGLMRLYNIDFLPKDPNAWNGKGMKWNIRGHGVAQWDCRNLNFHKAVEHGAYIDNHQGDSYFIRCRGGEMGRTLLQITNRQQSGPAAFGDLVIQGCVAQNIKGDGGSDFTIVGNGEGTIWFINNKSFGAATGSQGAFVHWTDFGHGAYLTETGFSSKRLIVLNFESNHPNADRDHMAISGVEEVIVAGWDIAGNRTGIHMNTPFGGGVDNGKLGLYTWKQTTPSQWPGWKSNPKMKDKNVVLSNAQIDALEYMRG